MIWVKLDRAEALAHPKGRLGWVLWGIVCFLLIRAGGFVMMAQVFGGALLWVQVAVMLVLVAALVLRMPLALPLLILHMMLVIFWFVGTLEGPPEVAPLVDVVIPMGIIGYMLEAPRPNMIYRYRYRASEPPEEEG
ncbi:MAG: hypothetical protein AAFY59_18100 [Pseudomonadota bacterium]